MEPEDWLALIVGAQAHRSSNDGQRKFGDVLITRYFTEVPSRYSPDSNEQRYFDAMLCHVGAAMRGFSFVRDNYQTHIDSAGAVELMDLEAIRNLERFGPLTSGSVLPKAISAVVGGTILGTAAKTWDKFVASELANVTLLSYVFLGGVAGLMVWQWLVDSLISSRRRKIKSRGPKDIEEIWRQQCATGYKQIATQFLRRAYDVTAKFYPDSNSAQSDSEARIARAVEAQFTLLISGGTDTVDAQSAKDDVIGGS